jgi:hypothetical protein
MTEELVAQIDVDKRTTRGRSCPRCGGKIIPSNRAVYEAASPEETYPIWQCERCGYEEMAVTKKAPARKAAAPAAAVGSAQAQLPGAKPAVRTVRLDAKGRDLPPDVTALLQQMELPKPKEV